MERTYLLAFGEVAKELLTTKLQTSLLMFLTYNTEKKELNCKRGNKSTHGIA